MAVFGYRITKPGARVSLLVGAAAGLAHGPRPAGAGRHPLVVGFMVFSLFLAVLRLNEVAF